MVDAWDDADGANEDWKDIRPFLPPVRERLRLPGPPYDCCPACGGDCGSANPPVYNCPMRPATQDPADGR